MFTPYNCNLLTQGNNKMDLQEFIFLLFTINIEGKVNVWFNQDKK